MIHIMDGRVVFLKNARRTVLTLERYYDWSGPDEWIDSVSADNFIVSKRRLSQRARDINQLLDEIIPVPHISDAKLDGFVLHSLKEGSIINEAGFRKGDIIKGINGQRLDTFKSPLEVYFGL